MAKSPRAAGRHRKVADPLALAFGPRIKQLRLAQNFSFDAFVEETGLGRGYISELERGLVMPSLLTVHRLAAVPEVSMADLVLGESRREEVFDMMRGWPNRDVERFRQAAEVLQLTLQPTPEPAPPKPPERPVYRSPVAKPATLVAEPKTKRPRR